MPSTGRDFFINGESAIYIKGRSDSDIASVQFLGLTDVNGRVRITVIPKHMDILCDAWGNEVPVDVQTFLAEVQITFSLVHFDRGLLDVCEVLSMGGGVNLGRVQRAGQRMGGGQVQYSAAGTGNNYIALGIASPIGKKPWRFPFAFITGPGIEFPLGTERSVVPLTWRAIPYTVDPWGGGTGAFNSILWDHGDPTLM